MKIQYKKILKNRLKSPVMILTVIATLLIGGVVPANAENADDLLIIVNNKVSASSVSIAELKSIFLKERTSYKSGGKATPVNAKKGSALRNAFQTKVLSMSNSQEQTHWQNQKIKSGKSAPAELSNTVKAVFSIKGGISYCFRKDFKKGTSKIVLSL